MRKFIYLTLRTAILLWATTQVGQAAERITVDQLKILLAKERGRSDGDIARQLAGMELKESLNSTVRQRLDADLPGKKSRRALALLAGFSSFLAPPSSEIPDIAAPSEAETNLITRKAIQYLVRVIPSLPDYIATRTTTRFSDSPLNLDNAQFQLMIQPVRWVGDSREIVTNRAGKEIVEKEEFGEKKLESAPPQMMSRGEFGQVLIGLITDAFRSTLHWSHWETQDSKNVAVFHYSVPAKDSHFEVFENNRGQMVPVHPAYHGEITVDPDQGTILGLTMQGEWHPDDANVRSDLYVEFAPVDIGGKTYFCPSRSVAVVVLHPALPSHVHTIVSDRSAFDRTLTELNEVQFSDYHRFRAEVHVHAGEEAERNSNSPDSGKTTTKRARGPAQ